MKTIVFLSLLAACILAANQNTVTLINGFSLKYTIDGAKISFELTGTNKDGYVALGFGGTGMKYIDVAAFKWDGAKVVGEDRSNLDGKSSVKTDIELSCIDNLTVDPTSTYDTTSGAWNIKFSRDLNTNEPTCDQQIINSTGPTNLAFATFPSFTWGTHNARKAWSITFNSAVASDPNATSVDTESSAVLGFSTLLLAVSMLLF